jgi:uncharacterized membrane protein
MSAKTKGGRRPARSTAVAANEVTPRLTIGGRLRQWLLTGLLILGPSALTIWVLYRILEWFDGLIGPYIKIAVFGGVRIPGLGVVATLLLLLVVGAIGSWIGGRWVIALWDGLLTRIPGVGILYGSTKSLGEALLTRQRQAFRQVVLVPWPHPGVWRVGFVTGQTSPEVAGRLKEPHEVVFVPHTPNPASGFVHYVPRSQLIHLDWPVEDGLKVIVSGGVIQPGATPEGEPGAEHR